MILSLIQHIKVRRFYEISKGKIDKDIFDIVLAAATERPQFHVDRVYHETSSGNEIFSFSNWKSVPTIYSPDLYYLYSDQNRDLL